MEIGLGKMFRFFMAIAAYIVLINAQLLRIYLSKNKQAQYTIIKIGTPPQYISVRLDIRSSEFWIPANNCKNNNSDCFLVNGHYVSNNSNSYMTNYTLLYPEFYYFFGPEDGYLSTDIVNIAGLNVQNQTFGEVINADFVLGHKEFLDWDVSGVLGLAYSIKNGITPVFKNMIEQGLVSQPIFSFYLKRNTNAKISTPISSILILGGSDPAYYYNTFTYAKVIRPGHWQIAVDRITETHNNVTVCKNGCQAIFDFGIPWIAGPPKDIATINGQLGTDDILSEEYLRYGQSRLPNCRFLPYLPDIHIIISGETFILTPEDYIFKINNTDMRDNVCISAFTERSVFVDNSIWIFGGAFFGRYYTEFNMEKNRIGFAAVRN